MNDGHPLKGFIDAREIGLTVYQGGPCVHGHDGVRYVSNRICYECAALRSKRNQAANKDKMTARKRLYRARLKGLEATPIGVISEILFQSNNQLIVD
jgi:hypothetical protein